MNERREPTISTLGADADAEPPRARAANTKRPAGPPPVSQRPVIVRSPLGPFALIIALIALGGAGFVYWQGLQVQSAAKAELAAAEQRITELEQRLMLSDDESTQSMTVIQAKVKENASEIRKLWGVSYDTNRKAIAALEENFNALSKTVSTKDSATQKAMKDIAGELQVLNDLSQAQQAVIARSDQWVTQQKQSLDSVLKRVDTLDTQLNKRVSANEEAINAIDAFRVQVNRELINLKGG